MIITSLTGEDMEFDKSLKWELFGFLLLSLFVFSLARESINTYNWVLKETNYTRLCSTKKILTVNGLFPGPTLYARKGDTLRVNVQNHGKYNVTIHWHGVKQPRNPWSDGPEYITQCPIKPGANFTYEIILSVEEGTLWWHAHSDWSRATLHGAIIVYPKPNTTYPFTQPHKEFPIILGSWFKGDVMEIIETALASGGEPNKSDALTINGQPGDLYNCSKQGTFKMMVDYGKTYLLRIINAIMNEEVFLKVANHNLTVVGMDGAYLKPIKTNFIFITPGQTMDVLITANQSPSQYYVAARAYEGAIYDNTTTTAIFQYNGNYSTPSTPSFPSLPNYTDINSVTNFSTRLLSLASKEHPIEVPQTVDERIYTTISMNAISCVNNSCEGPNGGKLKASMNNVSFVTPEIDILLAYYKSINGVYTNDFPSKPPRNYNFLSDNSTALWLPLLGTKARVFEYNTSVEIVFQGTNVLEGAENHPMHLHGYSFYVVGYGFGIWDPINDPKGYNLVDPPELNTIGVPKKGWAAIRFKADNPGVWFMHCHLERHASWGMETVVIVRNGKATASTMLGAPSYLNPC